MIFPSHFNCNHPHLKCIWLGLYVVQDLFLHSVIEEATAYTGKKVSWTVVADDDDSSDHDLIIIVVFFFSVRPTKWIAYSWIRHCFCKRCLIRKQCLWFNHNGMSLCEWTIAYIHLLCWMRLNKRTEPTKPMVPSLFMLVPPLFPLCFHNSSIHCVYIYQFAIFHTHTRLRYWVRL